MEFVLCAGRGRPDLLSALGEGRFSRIEERPARPTAGKNEDPHRAGGNSSCAGRRARGGGGFARARRASDAVSRPWSGRHGGAVCERAHLDLSLAAFWRLSGTAAVIPEMSQFSP